MRFFLATVLMLSTCSAIAEAQPTRRVLYIVHRDDCLPCRIFDRIYTTRRDVRDALAGLELLELDLADPDHAVIAKRMGITQIPAFVMVEHDRETGRHVGFVSTLDALQVEPAIKALMVDLRIDWPARQASRPEPLQPATQTQAATITAPAPVGPAVDQFAREQIGQLRAETASLSRSQLDTQQQVSQLQTSVAGAMVQISRTQNQLSESTASISEQIRASQTKSQTDLHNLSGRLTETIRQTIVSLPPAQQSGTLTPNPAAVDRPDAGGLTLPPRGSDAETSDSGSRNATASSWISVASWVAKTAVTIAAPQIALPATAGLTALGYGLTLLRRRRSRAGISTGTIGQSVAVLRDTETTNQTANHYVVKEVDRGGEAYKEALRRTVAAYKSDRPGIVDVAGQIEHVAQELLRGQTVQARASQTPRPGIWTDEDHN